MKLIIGLTGASGSLVFKETILELLKQPETFLYIVATKNGQQVFEYELKESFNDFILSLDQTRISLENPHNMFSTIASGSSEINGMIITPCSMGTVAKIAAGTSDNLLIRAADVIIKEQKKLVLSIRETPLSSIHLRNLQILAQTNTFILPITFSFYNHPQTLEEATNQFVQRQNSYLLGTLEHNLKWENPKTKKKELD
ncbi:MAG: UbiX family flavin prenyltransferase [Mycoplasmatales bacterium]